MAHERPVVKLMNIIHANICAVIVWWFVNIFIRNQHHLNERREVYDIVCKNIVAKSEVTSEENLNHCLLFVVLRSFLVVRCLFYLLRYYSHTAKPNCSVFKKIRVCIDLACTRNTPAVHDPKMNASESNTACVHRGNLFSPKEGMWDNEMTRNRILQSSGQFATWHDDITSWSESAFIMCIWLQLPIKILGKISERTTLFLIISALPLAQISDLGHLWAHSLIFKII